jgi:serine protease Do
MAQPIFKKLRHPFPIHIMKPILHAFVSAAAVAALSPVFAAPTSGADSTLLQDHLRAIHARMLSGETGAHLVLVADAPTQNIEPKKQIHVRSPGHPPMEMENVTFLGVETGPVSPTLSMQLGLPEGAGLVVLHVVPDSAAIGALKEHDVLLRLDDQVLVDQHQLSVLVRNHKEGDQVTLTYVRGGKQATATVKLTKHEVPKLGNMLRSEPRWLLQSGAGHGEMAAVTAGEKREEVDQTLSMIQRAHNGQIHTRIEAGQGPGMRAVSINPANSNLSYSDEKGSLELTLQDGKKNLIAKDAKGTQQFVGPVNTPEERKAMPVDVRERLEKIEAMQNMTFHTDGDFEGGETRIFQPERRPIMLPRAPARRGSPPVF